MVEIRFGPGPDDVTVDSETFLGKAPNISRHHEIFAQSVTKNYTLVPNVMIAGQGSGPNRLRFFGENGAFEVLDFLGFSGMNPFGMDRKAAQLVARQIEEGVPPSASATLHPLLAPATLALVRFAAMPDCMVTYGTSGAFAVDAAITVAFKYAAHRCGVQLDGDDPRWKDFCVISAEKGYHGSSLRPRSFSSKDAARVNVGPLMPDVVQVPFGETEALEQVFKNERRQVVAVVLEPVQGGAAGCIVPREGYLRRAQELSREHGALFILDEVKTGFGRVGECFAYQRFGLEPPDLLCFGKAAGAGIVTLSGVIGRKDAMSLVTRGVQSFTWSSVGSACIALLYTIQRLSGGLIDEVREKEAYFRSCMQEVSRKHPDAHISLHGMGLLLAVESRFNGRELAESLLRNGLWTRPIEWYPSRVLVTPPLTVTMNELKEGSESFDRALSQL